jgi:hypothetical protein
VEQVNTPVNPYISENPGKFLPRKVENTVCKQDHQKIMRKNSLQKYKQKMNKYTLVKFPDKNHKILADNR